VLHYCSRSIDDTPFAEQLLPLAKQGKVILHHDNGDPDRGLKFDQLVAEQTSDSHYYGCGPAGFLDAYLDATSHLQEQFVHFERFTASKNIFQAAFTLKLQKSNRSIEVGKGESIVDALEREGVKVMTGCLAGACGLCRVPYLSGDVVHRDFRLTGEDRKRELTACVSGCNSAELVLDL
jgi:ferredoxin